MGNTVLTASISERGDLGTGGHEGGGEDDDKKIARSERAQNANVRRKRYAPN